MRRLRLGRWLQIRDGRSESIDNLEKEYWDHIVKHNVTPGKKTVLAMADSNLFDVGELRAQVGRWESGLRIETLLNKVRRKTELYVLLNDMRPCLNVTDVPKNRERSRSPAEMRVEKLHPLQTGRLPVTPQVNCGFPRRKKVARAERERMRMDRKKLKDETDSSRHEKRKERRSVPESEVGQQALGSMLRRKRRKLSSQKSRTKMVKTDKGKEREDRAQLKAKEKEREVQQKELKKKQMEERREDQRQTEGERKKWNSGWRKLNVSESACVRKSIKENERNHERNRVMVSGVISDVLKRVIEIVKTKKVPFQLGVDNNAVEDDTVPKKVPFQVEHGKETGNEKDRGLETEKELATEEKDSGSGESVSVSVIHTLLESLIEQLVMSKSLATPELTDDEYDEKDDDEDENWYDAEDENEEMADGGLTDSKDKEGIEGVADTSSSHNEKKIAQVGDDNHAVEENSEPNKVPFQVGNIPGEGASVDQVARDLFSPLRLRGSGDPMTQEELEGFEKYEIIEYLRHLGSHTDLTRNVVRLRSALLAEQISSHISQLSDLTVARVLKHFNREVNRGAERRKVALNRLYIGHPELQRDILDQIKLAQETSPSASESECSGTPKASDTPLSDGNSSSPCTPSSSDKAPGKPLSVNTPLTPRTSCRSGTSSGTQAAEAPCLAGTETPVTSGQAGSVEGQPLKLPWDMSRAELLSFLADAHASPCHTNKSTAIYRDKVGMIMVNNLLDKLDLDQVTEVLVRLNYDYNKHITRRSDNLRTHFRRKEANDEQTKFKQHNMLFLMMETVKAKSKTNVFQFPSAASSPGDATPPSVLDSNTLGVNKKTASAPPLSANGVYEMNKQSSFSGSTTGSPRFKLPAQRNCSSSSTPAKLKLQAPPKRQKTANVFTIPSQSSPAASAGPSSSMSANKQSSFSGSTSGSPHLAPAAQLDSVAQAAAQVVARPRVQVRFHNGGNWCYLNGLLNLLFSIPRFIEVLFEEDTYEQVNMNDPQNGPVLLELRRLARSDQETVVQTDNLKLLLGRPWCENIQQCSSDFFTTLYRRIECHNFAKLFRIEDTEEDRCLGSNCPPTYREGRLQVILRVPSDGESVPHILEQYSMPQQIDLVEPLHPHCGITKIARRNIISSNGEVMLLHLHRYEWNAQREVLDRLDDPIVVPLSLELDNKVWHLTGGLRNTSALNTTSQGHYTGVTRDISSGIFYKHNDHQQLEPLHGQEATAFLNRCYMLAYTRQESLPGGLAPPPLVQPLEGPGGDVRTPLTPSRRKNGEVIVDQPPPKKRCMDAAGDKSDLQDSEEWLQGISPGVFDFKQPNSKSKDKKPRAKKAAARKGTASNRNQFVNDFNPTPEKQAKIRAGIEARRLYMEERTARLKRNDFSLHGLPYNPVLEGILKMDAEMNSIEMPHCKHCDEVKFDVKLTKKTGRCPQCQSESENRRTPGLVRKFSLENGMHCSDVPDVLQNLTPVEQSAIQRAFVVMKIYRLNQGATFLKGHCLTVMQDVEEFAKRLPPRPADLPMVFLIGPGQRIPLTANANKILAALRWLTEHHPYYKDVEIDSEALRSYPDNDSDYVQGLSTIESDTVGHQKDPAAVYTEEEGDGPDVVYSALPVSVPKTTVKEEIRRVILDQPEEDTPKVEWPKKIGGPLNRNTKGFFSMVYPWLFPYGKPDLDEDRPGEKPKLLEFVKHTLCHKCHRFAHDPRYLLHMINEYQRGELMCKCNCYARYSCSDITVQELKEQVAAGNLSTFKSLMYFTRSIVGSRQFFKYEAKKAMSFVNWVHIMSDMKETFNLFLTLSIADLHEPALHRLLPGHELYLDKKVVNSLDQIPAGSDPSEYILASHDFRLRTEAVAKNGHIVCQYVNKKLWSFHKHVLEPLGVLDYIIRVEFQYRSSEHFHMILRLLDGASVEAVHEAFSLSEFEVLDKEKYDVLPPEKQASVMEAHARAEASRRYMADFSTFRLGQTAIHPEPNPTQWPPPEGLNREKPRENCLRRQFSDVVAGNATTKKVPFQVLDNDDDDDDAVQEDAGTTKVPFQEVVDNGDDDNAAEEDADTKKVPFQEGNILDDEETADRILRDYILLANRVQLHRCCRYCLKIVVATIALCKFHYPKDLKGFEAEMVDSLYNTVHNKMEHHPGAEFESNELFLARNHPRLVITIQEFLLAWRGNTCTEIIKSIPQLLNYVLKYMLKATTGSKSFENTIKDITNETQDDARAASIFQKVLMRQITEHDMSRTEAFRIALGLPFVFSSRKLKSVNLLGVRMVVIDEDSDTMEGANRRATKDNKADLYWQRENSGHFKRLVEQYEAGEINLPWHPSDINLYMYVTHFENNWQPAKEAYVPHISPQFRYPPDPKNPKLVEMRRDYLRTQLLTFEPGMRPQNLPKPENLETAMSDFIHTRHCPKMIRDEYLKSFENGGEEEEEVQPLLDDPEPLDPGSILQDPYMAGLGAALTKADLNNANMVDEDEEAALAEEQDDIQYLNLATDEAEDWSRDRIQLGLTSQQMGDAMHWLEQTKAVTDIPPEEWTESYEVSTLNPQQRAVYDRFAQYVMGEEPSPTGHLIDLSGGAGTGKSRLIKTMLYQSEIQSGDRNRVKVCAFTNSAARAFIGGKTVHKLMRLDVERGVRGTWHRHQTELGGPRLLDMQEDFRTTRCVIIDEKSMVGCFMLWCMDQRLRQARPHHSDQMFGGLVVILVGDLSQLPPVTDKPLFCEANDPMTGPQAEGLALFQMFKECFFLTESMRQQGASNELFRQQLTGMATGKYSIEDWHSWLPRSLDNMPDEERSRFLNEGVKLCSRKVDMVPFNEAGLLRCNSPILIMKAAHNNKKAEKCTEAEGEGLAKILPVARGGQVVLSENLWPETGLFNGSMGKVTYILFDEEKGPAQGLPTFIVVTFPEYKGPAFIPGEPGTVPIFPRTAEWTKEKQRCTRRNFPLLPAYALTIHKSQGMTIDKPVIVDIGPAEFAPGMTYTAVTRVRNFKGLAFQPMPSFNRIVKIFAKKGFKAKQKVMKKRLADAQGLADAQQEALPVAAAAEPPVTNSSPGPVVIEEYAPDDPARHQPLVAGQVCSFPLNERGMNHISMRDYRLLGRTEQLNDVLIKLGLDYMERALLSGDLRERLHVFNSLEFMRFTNNLSVREYDSAPSETLARAMHARVAHYTRRRRHSIDIFSKAVVLWPMVRDNHWFLVVGLNLGERNATLFTLNSYGSCSEGAILEHIKAYLAIEYETSQGVGSRPPAIRTLRTSPPQQTGGIDCGLFLLSYAEAIFSQFVAFSSLFGTDQASQRNWFPPVLPLNMRKILAAKIRQLSDAQNFGITSWPELDLV